MKSLLRLVKADVRSSLGIQKSVDYSSTVTIASTSIPGVRFTISRMSFAKRSELCRSIRELSPKLEFLEAGTDLSERVEANLLGQEIEKLYLRWGLVDVEALTIDHTPATIDLLISKGPESLCKEIVAAIQAECGLSEEERKN